MRPIARAVVANHYDRLPHTADVRFSLEDVQREMRDVTFDAVDHMQSVLIPASMMLIGGFLLWFARPSVKSHAP